MSAQPAPPFPGPRPGTLRWGVGGGMGLREADTRVCPQPSSSSSPPSGGRRKGRRKGERKGGKFQEPGLEQKKESVFLPFHQQTSTQEEVFLKKKKPEPTHSKRRLEPGGGRHGGGS